MTKAWFERTVARTEPEPRYRCTRCGRNEIDARANGCDRGPCPMEIAR